MGPPRVSQRTGAGSYRASNQAKLGRIPGPISISDPPPVYSRGARPDPACAPTRLDWQPGEPSPFYTRVFGSSIVLILANLADLILTPDTILIYLLYPPKST